MVIKGKCRMCGETFVYPDDLPPCVVKFFGKEYYADLCYSCGFKIVEFIKSYRKRRSWSQYVT